VRNLKIALDICDPTNPFIMVAIRGRIKQVTFDGADEHIDRMAKKYMGQDKYQNRVPGVRRVPIKIESTHVFAPFVDNPRWNDWKAEK
jgi:hypothetical protein